MAETTPKVGEGKIISRPGLVALETQSSRRKEKHGKTVFRIVFQTLEQLLTEEAWPKKKIGFTARERKGGYGVNGEG